MHRPYRGLGWWMDMMTTLPRPRLARPRSVTATML